MIIIAHRGLWRNKREQNTLAAFSAALEAGYGIETDLWANDPRGPISHDPPSATNAVYLSELLSMDHPPGAVLALNIKSDAAASVLTNHNALLSDWSWFAFDMSLPETVRIDAAGLPYVRRRSIHEPEPESLRGMGRWVDYYGGRYPNDLDPHSGLHVFVSPEIHGGQASAAWTQLRSFNSSRIALCTDLPREANMYFNSNQL